MTEYEAEVISAAIEYADQCLHGRFGDDIKPRFTLFEAIDALRGENDGQWLAPFTKEDNPYEKGLK